MVLNVQPTINESEEELMIQLRSVIITRSKDGATLDEIIDDYSELTGDQLMDFFHTRNDLMRYLSTIDGVWYSAEGKYGLVLWFCSTPKTNHIVEMIQRHPSRPSATNYRQYMPRAVAARNSVDQWSNNPGPPGGAAIYNGENNWRFETVPETSRPMRPFRYRRPFQMVRQRPYERPVTASHRTNWRRSRPDELDYSKYGPSYHRYQLLGDDFFLAIAKWELRYSFDPGHDIEMSGLCISGMTLSEAANRVQVAPYIAPQVLINVGTVDLLHGRVMIDLIHDFEQLMSRFRERNVEPIITTLAPIANCGGRTAMAERLLKFNEYIRRTCPRYVDLWKYFVHADGTVRFECYQPGPRTVSGSIRPHVLWNKLGRHHLLNVLGHEIAKQLTGSLPMAQCQSVA